MKKHNKILVILNSFYSTVVSIIYILKLILEKEEQISTVDLVILNSCNPYVINFMEQSITKLCKIKCNLITTINEIELSPGTRLGFKITSIFKERQKRKKFYLKNSDYFSSNEYKYVISGSIYYIGLLEKFFNRNVIFLSDHGISDLVSKKEGLKFILKKILGEFEHLFLYFSCNSLFAIKRISIDDNKFLGRLGAIVDSFAIKEVDKHEKDQIILILPVITIFNLDKIIEKFYSILKSRNLKNKNILCKAHPSLIYNGFSDSAKIFVHEMKKFKDLDNNFIILNNDIPIEFALSSHTTHVVGELSTVFIISKLLFPNIQVIEIDFIEILKNQIENISNNKLIHKYNVSWLQKNLTEQIQIKRLFNDKYKNNQNIL